MTRHDKDYREVIWMVQVLIDHIGSRIVSRLAGADGSLDAYVWPEPGDPGPDAEQAARVRIAYDVWKMIAPHHGDDFVSDWLLTANPLTGQRPADALAADDFASVLQAAQLVWAGDDLDEPEAE
jgi:hypothetical protein